MQHTVHCTDRQTDIPTMDKKQKVPSCTRRVKHLILYDQLIFSFCYIVHISTVHTQGVTLMFLCPVFSPLLSSHFCVQICIQQQRKRYFPSSLSPFLEIIFPSPLQKAGDIYSKKYCVKNSPCHHCPQLTFLVCQTQTKNLYQ